MWSIQIPLMIFCRHSKFMMKSQFLLSSQISGRMYNTVVSIKCIMWEVCRSPTLCRYWETIIDFKWHQQGSLSSFRPFTGWACTDSFENLSETSLKGYQSNDTKFNPPLFSLINIPLIFVGVVKWMFCLFSGLGAMGCVAGGRRVPAELLTSGHLYKQHYCHTTKLLPAPQIFWTMISNRLCLWKWIFSV